MKSKTFTGLTKIGLLLSFFVLLGLQSWGQESITAIGTAVTQNFDGLGNSGTWTNNTTLLGWYAMTDATSSIAEYGENDGTVTTPAGLYSFGADGTNAYGEKALGFVPSEAFTGSEGSGKGYIGWRLKNNTGKSIGTIQVKWTGEEWRKISAGVQNIVLSYQIGSSVTGLISGAYTLAGSQFNSPIYGTDGSEYALDGNDPANRTVDITIDLNVTIPAGQEIMLRWEDIMDPANHLLAIDDVSFKALKESQTITFGALSSLPYSDGSTFSLTGTASSNLTISYSSSNPSVISVSGSTATIHAAGQAIITASQGGNANYAPALDVTQVQVIVPAAPIAIAATSITGISYQANWNASSGGAEEYWFYTSTDNFTSTATTGSAGANLTASISGLFPNTTYYYRVRAKAGTEYSAYSNIITLTTNAGVQTFNITPSTPPDGNGFTSQKLTWSNGNLTGRIVLMREGTGSSCPNPTDLINYSASANWSTKGSQLGTTGFYCIYKGAGITVTPTNLTPGATYTVQAYEYTGSSSTSKFLTSVFGSNNPINFISWGTTTFTNTTPGQSTAENWNTAARWDHATVPTAALHSAVQIYVDGNCAITGTTVSNNLTIKAAHSTITPKLTINPGQLLTVNSTLTNLGGSSALLIKSTAAGTGMLLHNNSGVQGTVERYVTGQSDGVMGRYHLLSVPIKTSVTPLFSEVYLWSYLARYDESANGWHQMNTPTDNSIYTGLGYLTYDPTDAVETYYYRGELNYADVPAQMSFSNVDYGWNLVGNPYPCVLDWDAVTGKTNIGGAIYVWDQVNRVYKTYTGGIPANGNYIAPGQAFFVKATAPGAALTINNSARVLQASTFYKSTETTSDVLHLTARINELSDEVYLHFNPDATDLFDGSYDAYKLTSMAGKAVPNIYSQDAAGTKYSINSFPFDDTDKSIDLGFLFGVDGVATLSASGLETFASHPELDILLLDTKTNTEVSLKNTPDYTFSYVAADDPSRFKIRFAESLTGISNAKVKISKCNVFAVDRNISIQYTDFQGRKGYAYLIDAQGRNIKTVLLDGSGTQQIQAPVSSGMYMVKLLFSDYTETHKIAIR